MSTCTVLAKAHPLSGEWLTSEMPSGQTIAQMMGEQASPSCNVTIGGHAVPHVMWNKVRPRSGQTIHVLGVPQGGGGGKILRTVAMVALVALSSGVAAGTIGASFFGSYAALGGAAIMIGGSVVGDPLIAREGQS
ncbi:hypothetical protein [Dyella telluris]|uniref:Uncharacterized protein n=1 Tax=Dyella telluris TaxID=2763498 RepID=A0A7G8Q1S0_9GAMM|nr:hypothetical protein [Dyella telluris]QNK00728.1 hypothetical protein H8F01_16795 [Dyella telluris]